MPLTRPAILLRLEGFAALLLALGAIGLLTHHELARALALIWAAHIGMDRALNYGLKYPTQFKDSHLRRV